MPKVYDEEQPGTSRDAIRKNPAAYPFAAAANLTETSDSGNPEDEEEDAPPLPPDAAWIPRRAGEVTARDVHELMQRNSSYLNSAGMFNMESALWEETATALSKLDRGLLAPGDAMLAVKHATRKFVSRLEQEGAASAVGLLKTLQSARFQSLSKRKFPEKMERPFFLEGSSTPEEWWKKKKNLSRDVWRQVSAIDELLGTAPIAGGVPSRRKSSFEPTLAPIPFNARRRRRRGRKFDPAAVAPQPFDRADTTFTPEQHEWAIPETVRDLAFAFVWIQMGLGMLGQHAPAEPDFANTIPTRELEAEAEAEDIGRLLVVSGVHTFAKVLATLADPLLSMVKIICTDIWNRLWHGRRPNGEEVKRQDWFPDPREVRALEPEFDAEVFERQFTANLLMFWAQISGEVRKGWDSYRAMPPGDQERDSKWARVFERAENIRPDFAAEELSIRKEITSDEISTVRFSVGYQDRNETIFRAAETSFANAAPRNESVAVTYLKDRIDSVQGLQSALDGHPQSGNSTVGDITAKEAHLAGQKNAVVEVKGRQFYSVPKPNPLLESRPSGSHRTYVDAAEQLWREQTGQLRLIHVEFHDSSPDLAHFQAVRFNRNGTSTKTEWSMVISPQSKQELLSIAQLPATTKPAEMNLSDQVRVLLQPGMRFFEEAGNAAASGLGINVSAKTQQAPASATVDALIRDINQTSAATASRPDSTMMPSASSTQWRPRVKRFIYPATAFVGGVAAAEEVEVDLFEGVQQQAMADDGARQELHDGRKESSEQAVQHTVDGDQGLYLYRLHPGSTLTLAASLASGTEIKIEVLGAEAWLVARLAEQDWNFQAGQVLMEGADRAVVAYTDFGKDVTCSFYGKAATIRAIKELLDDDIASQPRVGRQYHADGKRADYRLSEGDSLTPAPSLKSGATIDAAVSGSKAWLALRLSRQYNTGRIEMEDRARDLAQVSYANVLKRISIRVSGPIVLVKGIKALVDADILGKQRGAVDPEEDGVNIINEGESRKLPEHPKKGARYVFEYLGDKAGLVLDLTAEYSNFGTGRIEMKSHALDRLVVSFTDVRNDVRVELKGGIAVTNANKKLIDNAILKRQRILDAEEQEIKAALPLPIPRSNGQTFLDEFYRKIDIQFDGGELTVADEVERIIDATITGDASRTFYDALIASIGHSVTRFVLSDVLTAHALVRITALEDAKQRIQRLGGGRFDINEKTNITCKVALQNDASSQEELTHFKWFDEFSVKLGEALRGKVYSIRNVGLVEGDALSISYIWPDRQSDVAAYATFKRSVMQERIVFSELGGKGNAPAFPARIGNDDEPVHDAPGTDEEEDDEEEVDENEEVNAPRVNPIMRVIEEAGGAAPGLSFGTLTSLTYKVEVFDRLNNKTATYLWEEFFMPALKGAVFKRISGLLEGKEGHRAKMTYAVPGFDHQTAQYKDFAKRFFMLKIVEPNDGKLKNHFAFPSGVINIGVAMEDYANVDSYDDRLIPWHPYWWSIKHMLQEIRRIRREGRGLDLAAGFAKQRLLEEQADLNLAVGKNFRTQWIEYHRRRTMAAIHEVVQALTQCTENAETLAEALRKKEAFEKKDEIPIFKKNLPSGENWSTVSEFTAKDALDPDDKVVLTMTHDDGGASLQPIEVPDTFSEPDEWALIVATLTNSLPDVAAGNLHADGWVVPNELRPVDGRPPFTDVKNTFYVRGDSNIKSIHLSRERREKFSKALLTPAAPVYNKPLAVDSNWLKVGRLGATRALSASETAVVVKIWWAGGRTDYIEIDIPENFHEPMHWPLYVANEINRLTDFAAGYRSTEGAIIRPKASANENDFYAPTNFPVEKIAALIPDKEIDDYIATRLDKMNTVADIRGDTEVMVEFEGAGTASSVRMSLANCLRGGVYRFIRENGIGDNGNLVNIDYSWPEGSAQSTRNLKEFEDDLMRADLFSDEDGFDYAWSFPNQIKDKEVIKVVSKSFKHKVKVESGGNVDGEISFSNPEECQKEIDRLADFFKGNEPQDNEMILRSPEAYMIKVGKEIYEKHKMPNEFDPDEMVTVNFQVWSDKPIDYLNPRRVTAVMIISFKRLIEIIKGAKPSGRVRSYGTAVISQRDLIAGKLKSKIKINTFNVSSGTAKLPDKVFQDLISADPSVAYQKDTVDFFKNQEFKLLARKGYKGKVLKTLIQHTQLIDNYDPEQRLIKGDAKLYPLEFSDGKTKVRLGKTLMYSDKDKSIHFLVMPDSQTSKAIRNPNLEILLRDGGNWNLLTDMLELTRDPDMMATILAHFKDADFEDKAFIDAYGAGYVKAIKDAREKVLTSEYSHARRLKGRRLSETTMELHIDKYYIDLVRLLNQSMDELTTSQAELWTQTWTHALKFVGSLIATALFLASIGTGVGGASIAAQRLGISGLVTSIATETGVWVTKNSIAENPAEAQAAFHAWLAAVVTESIGFALGYVPVAKWVYKSTAGRVVTDEVRSKVIATYIERAWGPSIGMLGIFAGPSATSALQDAIAEALIKQGMPDPREDLDFCVSFQRMMSVD